MPNTLDDFYSEEEFDGELQSPLFVRIAPPAGAPYIGRDSEDRPIAVAAGSEPNITHVNFGRRRPSRGHRGVALLLVSLLAATGWGAFFYKVARPTDGAPRRNVTADKTPAVNLAGIGMPDRPVAQSPASAEATPATPPIAPPTLAISPAAQPQHASVATTKPAMEDKPVATLTPSANISGSWRFETTVDGAQHSYDVDLQQQRDSLTGSGRDVHTQTPLSLTGTISGNRVTLTFAGGATQGKIVLVREEDGLLHGRFASTASQSPGIVEARRKD